MRDGMVRQVGTPAELYARPAHADVAEFMGYRNVLTARVLDAGDTGGVRVSVGGAALRGTAVERRPDGQAIVAVRPDDLKPAGDGPVSATVESAQYHGRDFYCSGRASDGTELYFCSALPLQKGEKVRLTADPARVLIYAGAS
jgi:putative spermidine/putrescine transport system ATP-binding protein